MGMFDDVLVPENSLSCRKCGKYLNEGFQSKDGDCTLSVIDFKQVNNISVICESCDTLNRFAYNEDISLRKIEDYRPI